MPIWASLAALMLALTATNLSSVRRSASSSSGSPSIKVAAIVAFIVIALVYVLGLSGGDVGLSNLTGTAASRPRAP